MIIKEFRVVLPMTVEEYQVGQLWSVAEASKNETGGGEGIEVRKNEPFKDEEHGEGQYTYKVYHLASRVPAFVKFFTPKGALEFHEEAWNAYPYCKTVITNPEYMKDNFKLSIESWHKPDFGHQENVHNLEPKLLKDREVIWIDIAKDPVTTSDYKPELDPVKVDSGIVGRGPLTTDWVDRLKSQVNSHSNSSECSNSVSPPYMCAYKLVRVHFKWRGLQNRVEKFVHTQERRIFNNFHRQVFCWMKNWHGLTMDDIRRIEAKAKEDLDEMRKKGSIRGTRAEE